MYLIFCSVFLIAAVLYVNSNTLFASSLILLIFFLYFPQLKFYSISLFM